jgi:hypothetical protein
LHRLQAELCNGTEDGKHETPPVVAEGVDGACDRWGQLGAFDDAGLLEFVKALGQKVCRDARQLRTQVAVAAREARGMRAGRRGDQTVCFEVVDSGCGIDASARSRDYSIT